MIWHYDSVPEVIFRKSWFWKNPDLDPNCLCSWKNILKKLIFKKWADKKKTLEKREKLPKMQS